MATLRTVSLILFCLIVPYLTIELGRLLPLWAEAGLFGGSLFFFFFTQWLEYRVNLPWFKNLLQRLSWVMLMLLILISEVAWTKILGYAIYGPPFPEFPTWRIVVGGSLSFILILLLNFFFFDQLFGNDKTKCDEVAENMLQDFKKIILITFGLLFLP